ncbi:DUF2303 family protein [Tianweitania sp. BSSL-BM11]|uniref:DUF2303 family protein n=1 Tax=Tianweitania aestuarii TaxID=2814886 RepID=A0ABS5RT33_9HYPH|nr:DUF2303 family protein [Tianweitania aestuarii]MBS9720210.1 DUF2303 family protein [Tianweitania aestuarii]
METSAKPSTVLTFEDEALSTAAALGAAANGAEIVWIDVPGEVGSEFPAKVPVGLLRGENPQFKDISNLLEPYRLQPRLRTGTANVQTLQSFIDLVNRHKDENSVLFANSDWHTPTMTAVIDYHTLNHTPAFGKHRIHYAFPLSEEWKLWVAKNSKPMSQIEFAAFLEDQIADLSSPMESEIVEYERLFNGKLATPSEVMNLSRGLEVHAATRVKQATTLQTGEGQIIWEEEHRDTAGNKLVVPSLFMLNISPFFMGEKVRIPVRLRYRAKDGSVTWFYQIYRPDIHVTEHVQQAVKDAADDTNLPSFEGEPEMRA